MNKYATGSYLRLENEDGTQLNARIVHTTTVNDVKYAMVQLETGLTVSYSHAELDGLVVFSW